VNLKGVTATNLPKGLRHDSGTHISPVDARGALLGTLPPPPDKRHKQAMEIVDAFLDGVDYYVTDKYLICNDVLWLLGPKPVFNYGDIENDTGTNAMDIQYVPILARIGVNNAVIRNDAPLLQKRMYGKDIKAIKTAIRGQIKAIVVDTSIGFPFGNPHSDIMSAISVFQVRMICERVNNKFKPMVVSGLPAPSTAEQVKQAFRLLEMRAVSEVRLRHVEKMIRLEERCKGSTDIEQILSLAAHLNEVYGKIRAHIETRILVLQEFTHKPEEEYGV